jgi:hypothetical protein
VEDRGDVAGLYAQIRRIISLGSWKDYWEGVGRDVVDVFTCD